MDLQIFYKKTYEYLLEKAHNHNVDRFALQDYFTPQTGNGNLFKAYQEHTLSNLFFRLAFHAQNGGQISKVIKFPTTNSEFDQQRQKIFADIFYDFDPIRVLEAYSDTDALFEVFTDRLNMPKVSAISKTQNYQKSMPYRYCSSILSAASFLSQFDSYDAVINKLKDFGDMAPIYLSFELYGFQIPLACDFIKELTESFNDFPKPDTHIIKLLFALGFIGAEDGDAAKYHCIKQMKMLANELQKYDPNMTSYKLDKIFWLICTETFYNHDNIPNSGDMKRKKFIEYIQKECQL